MPLPEELATFLLNPANYHPCNRYSLVEDLVPEASGVYAWCFNPVDLPGGPSVEGFFQVGSEGLILSYLGIAPDEETSDGNLRERLTTHLEGTARRSTLRYSLGALLIDTLNLEVVPHGERKLSFGVTEGILTDWIRKHGRFAYYEHEKPWDVEKSLIRLLHPPLNIDHNPGNSFRETLKHKRSDLRARVHGRQGA